MVTPDKDQGQLWVEMDTKAHKYESSFAGVQSLSIVVLVPTKTVMPRN